jgi:hypothetical protein
MAMTKLWLSAACPVLLVGMVLAQDCKKTEYGADEQKYLNDALTKFAACPLPVDASCRAALAQALEHIYSVKDFGSESKYLTPAEITRKVAVDPNWTHLGAASDQSALKSARDGANCGKATIAVLASDTGGHVAMILPGALVHSNGWKLDVPNSASFFTQNPAKSFAGKPLSYSFPKAEGIELYARK